ncbi:hypothetical protein GCM10023093_03510 [Nemorincola caseinilytica]|uniref:YcxB family protein n=1 Tax=Nemorincola caseinilytica TaxID=2054315 RepID=A0ABP8N735_9BACT
MTKRNITYHWGDRTLLITLGNKVSRRIRALYIAELIATLGMATIFLLQSLPFSHSIINWVAALGASALYIIAAYRFLARIFFKEQLLLDAGHITILRNTLLSRHASRFEWRHIGPLHYQGKPGKTDHPLKGKCFDYFGFETQEHLIQSLHHEGNLYFDTPNGRVYFAPGVYSWDAEKMVQMMRLYSGTALQLGPEWDDMLQEEQEFDDAASGN